METDRLNRTVRITCAFFALISTLLFYVPAWSESMDPKTAKEIMDAANEHDTFEGFTGSLNSEQLKTLNDSMAAEADKLLERLKKIEKENEGAIAEYNKLMAAEYADVEDSHLREDEAEALKLYKPTRGAFAK